MHFDSHLLQRFYSSSFWQAMDFNHTEHEHLLAAASTASGRYKLSQSIVNGFMPLCLVSPKAFGIVEQLSESPKAVEIAKLIKDVELGKHPLVKDARHRNISHFRQFKLLFESAISREITCDRSIISSYMQDLNLSNNTGNLVRALACCYVIEHIGPRLVPYFNNVLACLSITGKRNYQDLYLPYIYEHGLTEVDSHIGLVKQLISEHHLNQMEFEKEQSRFVEINYQHFQRIWESFTCPPAASNNRQALFVSRSAQATQTSPLISL